MIIIKTKEQIDGIRKSCKLLAQLFEELYPLDSLHELGRKKSF